MTPGQSVPGVGFEPTRSLREPGGLRPHKNVRRIVSSASGLVRDIAGSAETGSVRADRSGIRESCAPFVHLNHVLLRSGIPLVRWCAQNGLWKDYEN